LKPFFCNFEKIKPMKKFILLIITLIGITAWQSCQYEWIDPIDPDLPEVVSFSVDIIPIFNEGCNATGCHATGGVAPDLTPENAYASLFATGMIDLDTPEDSRLYTKCAPGGSMNTHTQPGDPELILQWITEGAENN
jgi:hypothetical protein